jgi:hypothetical protein
MNRDTPGYWRTRADEARLLARRMSLPEAKQTMLEIAANYERLAEIADRHASKE